MIEVNYVCCSCKNCGIKRCIKCNKEVTSLCRCILDYPSKILELETEFGKPNIILRICEDCEKDIIEQAKQSYYSHCL